ncbi:unnamed protein product [Ceratitis capitata]|uniref:(Mediterranean fruit fly) hypothetical protein n=1 Tax=Ceratitis capitata TaxID=7213 RepID=A0A811U1E7_CERCA|nr:unnamed protein product [Ceratitis capitata]
MHAFSGFNGFGQFGGGSQQSVNEFIEFSLENTPNDQEHILLLAASWSYTAYARGKYLVLRGFLTGTPNTSICLQAPGNINQLAVSDRFALVLCENGRLYKAPTESTVKLLEVKLETELQVLPQKRSIFGEPKSSAEQMANIHITHIACGSNINVAISATNTVYSVPSKIHQFQKHFRVQQLQCGFEHALLLSGNGDVYSWGNGFRGQLGQDVLRVEEAPVLIEALAGIKINCIAAGGWHSAAISAFGDLYTWGFNSNGQLGLRIFKTSTRGKLKQPTVFTLPQIIELPKCNCCQQKVDMESEAVLKDNDRQAECMPVCVYAGARHTLLQLNCGALYAAGWNAHGQLAVGRKVEYCDEFEKVLCATDKYKDKRVVCGAWCTTLVKKS